MTRKFKIGDRVALDIPGDPNDNLEGTVIAVMVAPWYVVRWDTGYVLNWTEVLLKEAPTMP